MTLHRDQICTKLVKVFKLVFILCKAHRCGERIGTPTLPWTNILGVFTWARLYSTVFFADQNDVNPSEHFWNVLLAHKKYILPHFKFFSSGFWNWLMMAKMVRKHGGTSQMV